METNSNENAILENQTQVDTLIMKKIRLNKDQQRKLDIMTPFYYNEHSKVEAGSLLVGDAIEYYFQHKYVEDIKNLSS